MTLSPGFQVIMTMACNCEMFTIFRPTAKFLMYTMLFNFHRNRIISLYLPVEMLKLKRLDDLCHSPDVNCHGLQSLDPLASHLSFPLQLSLVGACSANAETVLRCRQLVFCVVAKWMASSGSSCRTASPGPHSPRYCCAARIALLCQQQYHSC